MTERDDLSRALPDAPPPRPVPRRAAIEQAMARFDGREVETPMGAEAPRRTSKWRWPQASALVTAALVGIVSMSLWNTGEYREASVPPGPAPTAAERAVAVAEAPVEAPAQAPRDADPGKTLPRLVASLPERTPAAPTARQAADAAAPSEMAAVDVPGLAPPPPPPPPAPSAARARVDAVVADDIGAFPDASEVVVTGSRIQGASQARSPEPLSKAQVRSGRGDWNACTVDDPARSLAACRAVVDPSAPGSDGRVDAQIADGLTRAWAGDRDGAIAAFDRAIGLADTSSLAYLNRGLTRERSGDLRGALTDLNKAVRLSPRSAGAHYHRSLLRDRRGDIAGARADAKRAVALDPAYRAVIP